MTPREEIDLYVEITGATVMFLGKEAEFDAALVALVERAGEVFLLYDTVKTNKILMSQGMSREEAMEWFEFNIKGSHGEGFPGYTAYT